MAVLTPYIPEYITVHLGRPDRAADNVTVSFPDYIKNVASSEIYPTWPDAAIRANILAQISFTLNRVYTEWYRSRGYDFDITNSTAYDQSFVYGRDIFDRISRIVDELFNTYIRRRGSVEPLFAVYCDGRVANCNGLKQYETVTLANRGYSAEQILRYYYGNNIELVRNAPVQAMQSSYPGAALRRGSSGNDVQLMQVRLNRIARNYPAIPRIYPVNGVYGQTTEQAVRAFQSIFGLSQDGIVGPATWYRLAYLYASVKRLSELDSEGVTLSELPQSYPSSLRYGDKGDNVRRFQYFLAVVGQFYSAVRPIRITGVYDDATRSAVLDYQRLRGLTADGIAGRNTWRALYSDYLGIVNSGATLENGVIPYPGETLAIGSTGSYVRALQGYLAVIARYISSVPAVTADGIFGARTENAVRAVQRLYGVNVNGIVDPITWNAITSLYSDVKQ